MASGPVSKEGIRGQVRPAARREPAAVQPLDPLPQQLVAIMRAELPTLYTEVEAEVCRLIPTYGGLIGGPYEPLIRQGTRHAIAAFVEHVAHPGMSFPERDELCRTLGRLEALHGRSLDDLQRAYRLGIRLAWRRAIKTGQRYKVPAPVMSLFADALFGYVEELIALSREGYQEAKTQNASELAERRQRLLRLLLAGTQVPGSDVEELAEHSAWPLPAEVTMIALEPGADLTRGAIHGDVLSDLADARPYLLLPGQFDVRRRRMLHTALRTGRAAAGITVPLAQAAQSLRWARQTLRLVEDGVIEHEDGIARSDDNILTLWLHADPTIAGHLAAQQLAPLEGLTPARRKRLLETLTAYLATQGNATQMAENLHIHPQTVRYRMRILEDTLGPLLDDPDWRFATEVALRAQHVVGG